MQNSKGILGLLPEQTAQIEKDFAVACEFAKNRKTELFNLPLDATEALCMKFLYAYMPSSDLANYNSGLLLTAVCAALKAKSTLPWGEKIDGILFLNDILSFRLNNEDLVDYRDSFYDELFEDIKGMDMEQAVLHINYWCFQKATYQSTDIRTSSPLNVIRNAFGRCGEESVLCVAALRSMCIPARQCYTPRWAHCDDNHAWVEVWVDGKWHFIGACEPEPLLDRGWFIAPAQRGMLIHARSFSRITGNEEATGHTDIMTQLNILPHYAKTKKLTIKVTKGAKPLEGAIVRFELINFAQLFPLLTSTTDKNGEVVMTTGFGDLWISVSTDAEDKNGCCYLAKKASAEDKTICFDMLDAIKSEKESFSLTMTPPPALPVNEPVVSEELAAIHDKKIEKAIKIRQAFEATFIKGEKAEKFAKELANDCDDCDEDAIASVIALSNGNHKEIESFLRYDGSASCKLRVKLLQALNPKDLSDSVCECLKNHLEGAMPFYNTVSEDIFIKYVANPRVYFEMISDYRSFIGEYFTDEQKSSFISSPRTIMEYIAREIGDCADRDYSTTWAWPKGLLELKRGSAMSKKILFVAICRTLGVPSRMNMLDLNVEYLKDGEWNVIGEEESKQIARSCRLTVKSAREAIKFEYEKNISLAILKNGQYTTLGLSDVPFENGSASYMLEAGEYRITTANRMTDGSVLALLYFVTLKDGCDEIATVDLREDSLGADDGIELLPIKVSFKGEKRKALDLLPQNSKNVIAFLEEGKEPTEHLLNEIIEQETAFLQNNSHILLIAASKEALLNATLKKALEKTGIKIAYSDMEDAKKLFEHLSSQNKKLPLVIGIDQNNKAIFHTTGYNVGTGSLLLKHIEN